MLYFCKVKQLRLLFDFYLNSSIHVALGVACLQLVTYKSLLLMPNYYLLLFTFFGTITGYNFIKYAGVAKLHHRSLTSMLRLIQMFSFLCFGALLYFLFRIPEKAYVVLGGLGLLTLLYTLPVFSQKRNLRSVKGFKIYIIALVWVGVTVLLPIVVEEVVFSNNHWLVILQRFIYVVALTLPFEIRDLKYDRAELGTLPQILGVIRTKILGYLLTVVFLMIGFATVADCTYCWFELVLIGILLFVSLNGINEKKSHYYAAFWVEGISILWGLVAWWLFFI